MDTGEAVAKHARQGSLFGRNDLAQPFLKWAGGKRQLLPKIRQYIPKKFNLYFEPFVGAGAVLFDLQPPAARINDINTELINCYRVIKSDPEELIRLATKHRQKNTRDYYNHQRSLDRKPNFDKLPAEVRAARIIYLNKTCYNGLFRVNKRGQFNAPYGDYRNPQIINPSVIRAVSRYLNEAHVEITDNDFREAVGGARAGDFIYFDPPYDPTSKSSSFTSYSPHPFAEKEQEALKEVCDELTDRGCKVLLSNSPTEFIWDLYSDKTRYAIEEVKASRSINSVASGRGKIKELLIFNKYDVA